MKALKTPCQSCSGGKQSRVLVLNIFTSFHSSVLLLVSPELGVADDIVTVVGNGFVSTISTLEERLECPSPSVGKVEGLFLNFERA